jgi:hypothetical protein
MKQVPIHCLFTAYALPMHCLCTAYSLPVHCLSAAYSLPIHCLCTQVKEGVIRMDGLLPAKLLASLRANVDKLGRKQEEEGRIGGGVEERNRQ